MNLMERETEFLERNMTRNNKKKVLLRTKQSLQHI